MVLFYNSLKFFKNTRVYECMTYRRLAVLCLITVFYLSGCATMNQAECLSADWRVIGMEDGSNGHLPSYLGEHRTACATYGVSPDLDSYMDGHRIGVKQYCTAQNGFNEGQRGDSYNGVCPANLEIAFLPAYEHGYEHYLINKEIRSAESSIRYKNNDIEDLKEEIAELEKQIISDGTTSEQRASWLERVKQCQTEIGHLEAEIAQLYDDKLILNERLNQHNLHH
jgi:hypothetical protein